MPLSNNVWWTVFVISTITIAILASIYHHERFKHQDTNHIFSVSALTVFGIIGQQGCDTSGKFTSLQARIVLLFTLVMSFCCYQFYSASIVGSLLSPPIWTINSIKKLTESNLKIILENVGTSVLAFKLAPMEDVQNLYKKKVEGKEEFLSPEDGIKKVQKGGVAFFTIVDYTYYKMKRQFSYTELDDLQELPLYPEDHRSTLYLPIQKYSPFKEIFRIGNLKIHETGLYEYHFAKHTFKKPIGDFSKWRTAEVDFGSTCSILYFLLYGYLISIVVFIIEKMYFRYHG